MEIVANEIVSFVCQKRKGSVAIVITHRIIVATTTTITIL